LKCVSHVSSVVTLPSSSSHPVVDSFPLQATISNHSLWFRPLCGLPPDDPSVESFSTACTGSHVLLSHPTVHCCLVLPHLTTRSHSISSWHPLASLSRRLTRFSTCVTSRHPSVPRCSPRLFFTPCSVLQLHHHLLSSRAPAALNIHSLDPTLNWFFN
jgi:hypothetical protein